MPPKPPTKQQVIDSLQAQVVALQAQLGSNSGTPTTTPSPQVDLSQLISRISSLESLLTAIPTASSSTVSQPIAANAHSTVDPIGEGDQTAVETHNSGTTSNSCSIDLSGPVIDTEAAPLLLNDVHRFRIGEHEPEYFEELFGSSSTRWPFPTGVRKDGHLVDAGRSEVVEALRHRLTVDPGHRFQLLQYIEEWPTLHQSILYANLQASALHQLKNSLIPAYDAIASNLPVGRSLFETINRLFTINVNLLRDLLQRADVIVVAANYGFETAHRVYVQTAPTQMMMLTPAMQKRLQDSAARRQTDVMETSFTPQKHPHSTPKKGGGWGNYKSNNQQQQQSQHQAKRPKLQQEAKGAKPSS